MQVSSLPCFFSKTCPSNITDFFFIYYNNILSILKVRIITYSTVETQYVFIYSSPWPSADGKKISRPLCFYVAYRRWLSNVFIFLVVFLYLMKPYITIIIYIYPPILSLQLCLLKLLSYNEPIMSLNHSHKIIESDGYA